MENGKLGCLIFILVAIVGVLMAIGMELGIVDHPT